MLCDKPDEILLGVGHGFLSFSEQIILSVKELRLSYFPKLGITVPIIHLVDHDIEDFNGNYSLLKSNEYVIYFYGEEIVRKVCSIEQYAEIVDTLRMVIEEKHLLSTFTS